MVTSLLSVQEVLVVIRYRSSVPVPPEGRTPNTCSEALVTIDFTGSAVRSKWSSARDTPLVPPLGLPMQISWPLPRFFETDW
jgi:hypothetical protein